MKSKIDFDSNFISKLTNKNRKLLSFNGQSVTFRLSNKEFPKVNILLLLNNEHKKSQDNLQNMKLVHKQYDQKLTIPTVKCHIYKVLKMNCYQKGVL